MALGILALFSFQALLYQSYKYIFMYNFITSIRILSTDRCDFVQCLNCLYKNHISDIPVYDKTQNGIRLVGISLPQNATH